MALNAIKNNKGYSHEPIGSRDDERLPSAEEAKICGGLFFSPTPHGYRK